MNLAKDHLTGVTALKESFGHFHKLMFHDSSADGTAKDMIGSYCHMESLSAGRTAVAFEHIHEHHGDAGSGFIQYELPYGRWTAGMNVG